MVLFYVLQQNIGVQLHIILVLYCGLVYTLLGGVYATTKQDARSLRLLVAKIGIQLRKSRKYLRDGSDI